MPEIELYSGINKFKERTKMRRSSNLTLIIVALLFFSYQGLAQVVQKRSTQGAAKKELSTKVTKEEAVALTPLDKNSREYRQIVADKNFLAACEILAADGEMFVAESGQLSRDGEKFAATFNVVNEASQSTGAYRQLVYAFDGKESIAYFTERNENFTRPKSAVGGSAKKLSWPPSWWPGSGGGTISVGGGVKTGGGGVFQSWGDWHEVSIDNCHFTFSCPAINVGKMRQEQRTSNGSPTMTQTRWILIHCGCY
jgi:hypothetical protein